MNDFISSLGSVSSPFLNADIPEFIFKLLGASLCCWALGRAYKKFGRTVSDRNTIGLSVIYLGLVTTFIISIVQSSVALSLGLVGSLSIVRFRTPVKEAEELLILFAAIAIGVGFGSGQIGFTLITLLVLLFLMVVLSLKQPKTAPGALSLHLSFQGEEPHLNTILNVLESKCLKLDLLRMDYREGGQNLTFRLVPKDLDSINTAQTELRTLNKTISTSLIDYHPLQ